MPARSRSAGVPWGRSHSGSASPQDPPRSGCLAGQVLDNGRDKAWAVPTYIRSRQRTVRAGRGCEGRPGRNGGLFPSSRTWCRELGCSCGESDFGGIRTRCRRGVCEQGADALAGECGGQNVGFAAGSFPDVAGMEGRVGYTKVCRASYPTRGTRAAGQPRRAACANPATHPCCLNRSAQCRFSSRGWWLVAGAQQTPATWNNADQGIARAQCKAPSYTS